MLYRKKFCNVCNNRIKTFYYASVKGKHNWLWTFCLKRCLYDYPAAPVTTPHKTISLLIAFIPILPSIQTVFRVFAIVFERYFFTFVPVVVDCLLLSVLSLLSTAFFFPGIYISIVFKSSSMALQRTIYELLLEAIIIPKCTYFHLQRIKTFHFWH